MKKNLLFFIFLFSLFTLNAQTISTFAGIVSGGYSGNGGQASAAELDLVADVAFDKSGNLYVADRLNNVVRMIDNLGIIRTIAGNRVQGYSGDGGPATTAEFNGVVGVLVDSIGNIYIADTYNCLIRKVNTMGIINTIAGNYSLGCGYNGDGGPATATELYIPCFMVMDNKGNLIFADGYNNLIRKIDTAGIIINIAGNSIAGYSGDGGPATAAELTSPEGVAIDAIGNIFIGDGNNEIRKVNTSGIISSIAGNGYSGYSGDGGAATAAEFNQPAGVTLDAYGNIYVADEVNNVIRMINSTGIISTIVGNSFQGYSGDGGPATAAELYNESALVFDASGNMFIADEFNNVVREVQGITLTGTRNETEKAEIKVYPNPSTGIFTFQITNNEYRISEIEVFNLSGEKIYSNSYEPLANCYQLDLSSQPAGIYIINAKNSKTVFTQKILKTNP